MDEHDILRTHLREVRRYTPPTREEELDLVRRAQGGDEAARNSLVERNARLIGEILSLYYVDLSEPPTGMLDLIQEGYLGLIAAVERYDPESKWRFTTYAGSWIRKYVSAALGGTRSGVRLPDHARRKSRRLLSAEEQLMQELGRRPTDAELADRCGITEERLRDLRGATETPLYLDAVAPAGMPVVETMLGSGPEPDMEAQCSEVVRAALAHLLPRYLEIVWRYHGVDGREESCAEIAESIGLSRAHTWDLYREAIRRLRAAMGSHVE